MIENENELPDLAGIDIQAGLEITRNNVPLYRKLLLKFRDGQQNYEQELLEANNSNDLEKISLIAHTLKGVAGNLGMTDTYNAAMALEVACKERSDNIDELLKNTITNLQLVVSGLNQLE